MSSEIQTLSFKISDSLETVPNAFQICFRVSKEVVVLQENKEHQEYDLNQDQPVWRATSVVEDSQETEALMDHVDQPDE